MIRRIGVQYLFDAGFVSLLPKPDGSTVVALTIDGMLAVHAIKRKAIQSAQLDFGF